MDDVRAASRKLSNLGIDNDFDPCHPNRVVFDYSSIELSPRLRTILAFGPEFACLVIKLILYNFFSEVWISNCAN